MAEGSFSRSGAFRKPSLIVRLPLPSLRSATATPSNAAPAPGLLKHFSQSQLALALAIQKSVPPDTTAREHCLQLRKHITIGNSHGINRYVDTPDFWKDQYSRLHEEKKALEAKVRLLEEEKQLRGSSESERLDSDPVDTVIFSSKRTAQSQSIEALLGNQEPEEQPSDQDIALRLSRYALHIARNRITLSKLSRDTSNVTNIEHLSKSCSESLALLEAAMAECTIACWSLKCGENTQIITLLQQFMYQIELSYHLCFNILDILSRTIIGRQKRYDIVYRLVMFFSKGLDYLKTLCNIQGRQEMAGGRTSHSKRARIMDDEYAINKYLTRTLTSITQLEWKVGQPGHSDILEGILFSVLDHVGRLLSNAVFGEHLAISNQPGITTKNGEVMQAEAARLQSRYFVQLLHAALGSSVARKELLSRILTEGRDISAELQPRLPSLTGHEMFSKARKSIQSSLLRSAMGGEGLKELRMPTLPEEYVQFSPEVDMRAERYGSEWLLESIWALVGWEMAAKE